MKNITIKKTFKNTRKELKENKENYQENKKEATITINVNNN